MQPIAGLSSQTEAELTRRHHAASFTVRASLALTLLLSCAAFLLRHQLRHFENETLDRALRITILIFGLGSVILRRRRFSASSLQDVTVLRGISGLIATLMNTTLQVAFLGLAMAIFGFVVTLMTGNEYYAYGAGLVGFVVLLYGYPTRNSWHQTVQKYSEIDREALSRRTLQTTE